MNVSGKSIKDLMNLDIEQFNSLTAAELRNVTNRLVSAGNKRLRRFEAAGEVTPATSYIERSGGKFSTKGKDINELRAEYARAKGFLQSKTGTRRGWEETKKSTANELKKYGVNVAPDQLGDVLRTYEKLKELDPSISMKSLKYTVLQAISTLDENADIEEKMLAMQERLQDIYEEQAALDDEFLSGGVSDYFEI